MIYFKSIYKDINFILQRIKIVFQNQIVNAILLYMYKILHIIYATS